jgi:hypothetical protein
MNTRIWTVDDIYLEPDQESTTTPSISSVQYHPHLFTPAFMTAIAEENSAFEDTPTISESDQEAVGLGHMVCPMCSGTGRTPLLLRCEDSGITLTLTLTKTDTCPCLTQGRAWGSFWRQWGKTNKRFKACNLATLSPSTMSDSSFEQQAANIKTVKDNPTGSYLLAGDTTCGKTYLTYCLYRNRLLEWASHPLAAAEQSVWMFSATEYLDSVVRRAQDPSAPRPIVTPEIIRNRSGKGLPVAIFIDEIDKFVPSETRISELFELVNAAYECEAQVVMTSNLTYEQLLTKWPGDIAEHILRRVGARPDGRTLTFTTAVPESR